MKAINGHENYRLHCRLKDVMELRDTKVDELHRRARISRETISVLRGNTFKAVSSKAMARICGAMNIGIGELFEVLPEDIWLPIRLTREVTIHFGVRTITEPHPARSGAGQDINRELVGSWDLRAFQCISEYLASFRPSIRMQFSLHATGPRRSNDPLVSASAERIFERGNHLVIGSPIANQFTEEVVCHAYGVPPYNPQMRTNFPYGFLWDDWRQVRSSFGWQGQGTQFGIAATKSNKLIAPHVVVPSGEGSDGGLVLTYRVFQAPAQREVGDADERVIICLLGYSGPGTLATARVATDPDCAAGLYPNARKLPRLRAVRCKHFREPTTIPGDHRELTEVALVPEQRPPTRPSSRNSKVRAAAGARQRAH